RPNQRETGRPSGFGLFLQSSNFFNVREQLAKRLANVRSAALLQSVRVSAHAASLRVDALQRMYFPHGLENELCDNAPQEWSEALPDTIHAGVRYEGVDVGLDQDV